jgi:hypothetical protein
MQQQALFDGFELLAGLFYRAKRGSRYDELIQ